MVVWSINRPRSDSVSEAGQSTLYERDVGVTAPNNPSSNISDNASKKDNGDMEKAHENPSAKDPNLVEWSENDPENPLNWTTLKTWTNLGTISFFRFLSPLTSSMIAPATNIVLRDFGIKSQLVGSLITSIYVLGYALGPLLLAPLSELYGRLWVYHINNILFVAWNLGAALSPNVGALLAFRLLAGLAGSCPVTIGNGSIADCVPKEKRGTATAIFTAGPLLGPVIGPIAGGFLGEAEGWRWIFWVLTIASGLLAVVSIILQHETYGPVLLERRTSRLRKETGNQNLYHAHSQSLNRPKKDIFKHAVNRPLRMLFLSPIVLITSLYVGLVYAYTYLLFTSFGTLFEDIYGFGGGVVGLTYLGFGVGCTIGLWVIGGLSDRIAKHYATETEWKPEYRLVPLLPGSLMLPIGLFWYGWSAQARLHWIMPIIGTGWVGLGTLAVFMPVQTYLIDAFPLYAASASAANTIFRSLMGAFVPLAGPAMYSALGQGWGNSLLAFIALAFTPVAWLIFKYGEKIRKSHPVDFS